MRDAQAQWPEVLLPNCSNLLSKNFVRKNLHDRHLVPRIPPRIEPLQEDENIFSLLGDRFIRAPWVLPGRLLGRSFLPAFGNKTFDNLVKAQEAVECTVCIQSFPVDAGVLTKFVKE